MAHANTSGPWYRNGLKFECTQCGNCCTGGPGYVWVTDEDIRAIADHLDKPLGEIRLLHTRPAQGKVSLREHLNGDCTFLNPHTRRCDVYPVRPVQCRSWPFWQSNLVTPKDWAQTCEVCPGAGNGPLVHLEMIEDRVSQSAL